MLGSYFYPFILILYKLSKIRNNEISQVKLRWFPADCMSSVSSRVCTIMMKSEPRSDIIASYLPEVFWSTFDRPGNVLLQCRPIATIFAGMNMFKELLRLFSQVDGCLYIRNQDIVP